jgi:nucleoside phosphorylase
MCGVCAGNPSALSLGDVVIADMAYMYDEGKVTTQVFEPDQRQTPMLDTWIRAAQELKATGLPSYGPAAADESLSWLLDRLYEKSPMSRKPGYPKTHLAFGRYFPGRSWERKVREYVRQQLVTRQGSKLRLTERGRDMVRNRIVLNTPTPSTLPFAIKVGPIASGNVVVKDGRTWKKLVRWGVRTVLGLEMEAAAIAVLAKTLELDRWVVVKGVMDHGDHRKDDRYKAFAARASAEVLFRFLSTQRDSFATARKLAPLSDAEAARRDPVASERPQVGSPSAVDVRVIDGTVWMSGASDKKGARFSAEIRFRLSLAEGTESIASLELGCVNRRGLRALPEEQLASVIVSDTKRTPIDLVNYTELTTLLHVDRSGVVIFIRRWFRPRLPEQFPYEWDEAGTHLVLRFRSGAQEESSVAREVVFLWSGARALEPVDSLPQPPRLQDAELIELERQRVLKVEEVAVLRAFDEEERYLMFRYPEHYRSGGTEYIRPLAILETLHERLPV